MKNLTSATATSSVTATVTSEVSPARTSVLLSFMLIEGALVSETTAIL